MKHINEYLLSKNNKIVDDFKQFMTKEEVCDFFDNKEFEKFESTDYDKFDDMISEFSDSKKPIYCIGEFEYDPEWWVRFGKGGEDEPIFFWNLKGTMTYNYVVSDSQDRVIKKIFETFEEFKEYTIKYFNW